MNLNQINLGYLPAEDRVLMRINTSERAELRFWLTRRVFIQLSQTMQLAQRQLGSSIHSDLGNAPQLQVVQQFEQAALAAEADLKSDYVAEAASFPLGETPTLVTNVIIKTEGALISGSFELATNQTITINFDPKLAAGFSKLLTDLIKVCDWNIPRQSIAMPAVPLFNLAESKTVH